MWVVHLNLKGWLKQNLRASFCFFLMLLPCDRKDQTIHVQLLCYYVLKLVREKRVFLSVCRKRKHRRQRGPCWAGGYSAGPAPWASQLQHRPTHRGPLPHASLTGSSGHQPKPVPASHLTPHIHVSPPAPRTWAPSPNLASTVLINNTQFFSLLVLLV